MTPLSLDHLVIAVRDLAAAAQSYRRLLGRAPSWRGRHPTYGTANVLFRLDNTYIELLAPDGDGGDSPRLRALRQHLDTTGEGLYAIALGTDDIDRAVADSRAAGLTVADPAAGDGVDLDTGTRRQWRNARIDPQSARTIPAFFIQHLSPPDALPPAPPEAPAGSFALGVDHTVVASTHLTECLALWRDTLGLELRATVDWPPPDGERRLHFLRLGDSILELAGRKPALSVAGPERSQRVEGPPSHLNPRDLLWGASYRVGDVAAAVDRLRAAGLVVSDPRTGNAPGTLVADLKPGFSHDVRTLFIQKDAP